MAASPDVALWLRERLHRATDPCLSRRSRGTAGDGRLSTDGVSGHLPRTLSREPRDTKGNRRRCAAAISLRAAHGESRVPAGTPHDGADPVVMVPALRSQSADVR